MSAVPDRQPEGRPELMPDMRPAIERLQEAVAAIPPADQPEVKGRRAIRDRPIPLRRGDQRRA